MNFQFYLEKLKHSKTFQEFLKASPNAYICSGFFTIDKEGKDNQRHIDLYLPKEKRIISFSLENEVNILPNQQTKTSQQDTDKQYEINKLSQIEELDFDFGEIESLILEAMEKNEVKNKLQKILISLQEKDGKNSLVCTVFVSGFGLLKAIVDLNEKKVTNFEKKSFFDVIKKIK